MERSSYCHAISGLTAMSSAFQPPTEDTQYGPILDPKVLYPRNANKTHGSVATKLTKLQLYLSVLVPTLFDTASMYH